MEASSTTLAVRQEQTQEIIEGLSGTRAACNPEVKERESSDSEKRRWRGPGGGGAAALAPGFWGQAPSPCARVCPGTLQGHAGLTQGLGSISSQPSVQVTDSLLSSIM